MVALSNQNWRNVWQTEICFGHLAFFGFAECNGSVGVRMIPRDLAV